VTLSARTPLGDVAKAVASALADHRIRAVLTGGACAAIHSEGACTSEDIDFVLEGRVTPEQLDAAMATLGFRRKANRYVHPRSVFWVEFPRGPLAIGGDLEIHPVPLDPADGRTRTLSATDSCRDRLAAFYHWSDRQSLDVAVEISLRHRIGIARIRAWSEKEGHAERFAEFLNERHRRARRRR
jgi:hypothetical protein